MSFFSDALDELNSACAAELGLPETIIYTPSSGSPQSMRALRRDPSTLESVSPGVVAALWFKASDFPSSPVNGGQVSIGSANYIIVDVREDAGGGVTLSLNLKR